MNHMEEVAKMLGVELGEKFEIEGCVCNPHKLTRDGLFDYATMMCPRELTDLLANKARIIKKPWVPKDGDVVWIVSIDNGEYPRVFHTSYRSNIAMFALGWYFRTREEAEAHAPEIKEQMRRILVGELRAELVEV